MERRSHARRGGGESAALWFSLSSEQGAGDARANIIPHFRPTKGGDDSDDEEGASRSKKQRKPKERKRIEKVLLSFLFSHVLKCF